MKVGVLNGWGVRSVFYAETVWNAFGKRGQEGFEKGSNEMAVVLSDF